MPIQTTVRGDFGKMESILGSLSSESAVSVRLLYRPERVTDREGKCEELQKERGQLKRTLVATLVDAFKIKVIEQKMTNQRDLNLDASFLVVSPFLRPPLPVYSMNPPQDCPSMLNTTFNLPLIPPSHPR